MAKMSISERQAWRSPITGMTGEFAQAETGSRGSRRRFSIAPPATAGTETNCPRIGLPFHVTVPRVNLPLEIAVSLTGYLTQPLIPIGHI